MTLPVPRWLGPNAPENARACLDREGWMTKFEKKKVHPFINEHHRWLARLWVSIVAHAPDGEFLIGANGPALKRHRPDASPQERQELAFLGLIEEAVFFANRPMRIESGRPREFYWEMSGGVIGVARASSRYDGRTRAICACLLNSSEAYWGRMRIKIAWALTLMATKTSKCDFPLEAARALADMLSLA
jgi:hypothetical protein